MAQSTELASVRWDYDSAKINEGSHEVSPHLDQTSPLSRTTPEGAHATADLSRSWRASDSCESAVLALVERIQPPFPRIIGPPSAFAVSNCLLWPLLNRSSPVRCCQLGLTPDARFCVDVLANSNARESCAVSRQSRILFRIIHRVAER